MSNFLTNLFGRKRKVEIDFVDLDQNKEPLDSQTLTGKKGEALNYDPQPVIERLTRKGYVLAQNGYKQARNTFTDEDRKYVLSFHHQMKTVDRNHLLPSVERAQVLKQVRQIVHYQGAGSRTPQASSSSVLFCRQLKVDLVTGQIKETGSWKPKQQTFPKIGVPIIPGFVPEQTVVGGRTIGPDDGDQTYTISFSLNKEPSNKEQMAEVDYLDLAHGNDLVKKVSLAGRPNFPINYDPAPTLKLLAKEGYSLISNNLTDVQFFGNHDGYVPVLIITLKEEAVVASPDHPDKRIPRDWYERQAQFVVNFVGADEQTPATITQKVKWSRTIAVNPQTKAIISHSKFSTPWQSDRSAYKTVKVPVVNGYHSSTAQVPAPKLDQQDHKETVSYHHNGRFIPVIASGMNIPVKNQYYLQTDPADPSKVAANQPVPQLKGFHTSFTQIAPTTADDNIRVIYEPDPSNQKWQDKLAAQTAFQNQDQQVAVVNFIDLDHQGKQLTSSGPLLGHAGEKINDLYSTALPLKGFKQAGYHVVFNDFDGQGAVRKFSANHLMTQVFTVGLRRGDAQMRLQQMTTQATALIKHQQNKLVMSSQLSQTLINLMSSLMDLILLLSRNTHGSEEQEQEKSHQQ